MSAGESQRESTIRRRVIAWTTALTLIAVAAPLQAQELSLRGGMGTALPTGRAANIRKAGPATLLSAELALSQLWSVRLDGEWSMLTGTAQPSNHGPDLKYGALSTIGATLNLQLRLTRGEVAPYLLIGGGSYRLQMRDAPDSPYGTTAGVQAGFGIETRIFKRINPFAEVRAQAHLTDYGIDQDFGATTIWPIVIGATISTSVP